jgi:hypothetical protein
MHTPPEPPGLVARTDPDALTGRRAQRLLEQWNHKFEPTLKNGAKNRAERRATRSWERRMRGFVRAAECRRRMRKSAEHLAELRCPR